MIVVMTAVVLLLIAGGVGWFVRAPRERVAAHRIADEPRATEERPPSLSSADTDSDELPDWEEMLRGTDPVKADTDGDGTTDGEEVRAGRNPLKAGPYDKENEVVSRLKELRQTVPSTREERKIGREGKIPPLADSVPPLEKGESPEQKSLHDYGNALGAAIAAHAMSASEETALWNQTLGATTSKTRDALLALAQHHTATAAAISAAAIPLTDDVRGLGAALAESYRTLGAAIADIARAAETGTVEGTYFVRYSDAAIETAKTVIALGRFFAAQGIRFTPNEPGALFALP